MARFIGTIKDYEKYIGPRIRNVVNTFSKNERDKCDGICEFCGKKTELHLAHKHEHERKKIINQVLEKYFNGSFLDIDINKTEEEILKLHEPIHEVFYFLCSDCHRIYDKNPTEEKPINRNSNSEKRTVDGMKIGQYVQNTFRKLFENNLLSNSDIENLQNKEYSKKIFNQNFEVLRSKGRILTDNLEYPRYYRKELFGENYYLTSEWYEYHWDCFLNWIRKYNKNKL
jgi:hypothetical protein